MTVHALSLRLVLHLLRVTPHAPHARGRGFLERRIGVAAHARAGGVDLGRVRVGAGIAMTGEAAVVRRLVMLLVTAGTVQVGVGQRRALRVTLHTVAGQVVLMSKEDGAVDRPFVDREREPAPYGDDDLLDLRSGVTHVAPLGQAGSRMMATPAIRRRADEKGPVLGLHGVTVEARQVAVAFMPKARVRGSVALSGTDPERLPGDLRDRRPGRDFQSRSGRRLGTLTAETPEERRSDDECEPQEPAHERITVADPLPDTSRPDPPSPSFQHLRPKGQQDIRRDGVDLPSREKAVAVDRHRALVPPEDRPPDRVQILQISTGLDE